MWKIFAGFIVFAALAIFVLLKGGDKVDMQGEAGMHQAEESHAPAAASATAAATPAAAPTAAPASNPASTPAADAATSPAAAVASSASK